MFRSGDIVKILDENCSNLPIYSHQKVDLVKENFRDGELCQVVMIKGWMFEPEHLELVKRQGIFVEAVQKEPSVSEGGSLRYNKGKPEFSHLSPEFIKDMMGLMTKSADKYGYLNWTKAQDLRTASDSLMRHFLSFLEGQDLDEESQMSHLTHIAVNAMIMWQNYKDFGDEVDNRFNKSKQELEK